MSRVLVVAKYKEDISWLSQLSSLFQLHIISKDPEEKDSNLYRLPNVGRESHSYLHFIVANYENLPELCVFTQASPFQHCPSFVERVRDLTRVEAYTPISDQEALFDGYAYPQLSASPLSLNKLCFSEYFEQLLGQKAPPLFYARMNGLFAVNKAVIRSRPLEFYRRCMTALEGETQEERQRLLNLNSVEGHFFERLWYFIFTPHWRETSAASLIPGMPPSRLRLVTAAVEKWSAELQRSGFLKASALLLDASASLNANPIPWPFPQGSA